ncbi:MAG: AI-2E family transporter [Caulobacteraceae bacterium]|jgi:predicted PurR-regulated permease PerM
MAVVLALSLVRFFADILAPLVVAAFMLLLTEGGSRLLLRRLPSAPPWLRGGIAGAVILAAFAVVAGLIIWQGPSFAAQLHALAPKVDAAMAQGLTAVGAQPMTIENLASGVDPKALAGVVFATLRRFTSFATLSLIYFGFLVASRTTFSRKFGRLYETEAGQASAERVFASVTNAVDRYAVLQTLKALFIAAVVWLLMTVMGVHDALLAAFLVFLSAYVPIVGAVAGSVFPGLLALAQFDDLARPLLIVGLLATAVFAIDNVVMPKLQGDELNLDPLFILISLGFWAAILGAPGVLLSTPLTVTVMAIAAEFRVTRWLAVLLSRDGLPGGS